MLYNSASHIARKIRCSNLDVPNNCANTTIELRYRNRKSNYLSVGLSQLYLLSAAILWLGLINTPFNFVSQVGQFLVTYVLI